MGGLVRVRGLMRGCLVRGGKRVRQRDRERERE